MAKALVEITTEIEIELTKIKMIGLNNGKDVNSKAKQLQLLVNHYKLITSRLTDEQYFKITGCKKPE